MNIFLIIFFLRYITQIQIVQFIIMFGYTVSLWTINNFAKTQVLYPTISGLLCHLSTWISPCFYRKPVYSIVPVHGSFYPILPAHVQQSKTRRKEQTKEGRLRSSKKTSNSRLIHPFDIFSRLTVFIKATIKILQLKNV